MCNKWTCINLVVFSEWLNDLAEVQDKLLLSSNPNADCANSSYKEKAKGCTFATSASNTASDNQKNQRECMLKDGNHPIRKCEKFKKMNVEEGGQKAKELKLCFKCLSDADQMRNCSGRLCVVNGCGIPHHRLLHRLYKNVEQKQNVENVEEVSNLSSMRSSGVLPVVPVTIRSGSKTLKSFDLCDSGASLSFVDGSLVKTLNLTWQPEDLNVAGIHGASDISRKRLRVNIGETSMKTSLSIVIPTWTRRIECKTSRNWRKHAFTWQFWKTLPSTWKKSKSYWAKIVITCPEEKSMESAETQSRRQCERCWDGCSVDPSSTRKCETRNWKLVRSRTGPISGSNENSVEHGIVCAQLQGIRVVQDKLEDFTGHFCCRTQLAGSQH